MDISTTAMIIDIITAVVSVTIAVLMAFSYRITRASGLGWISLGFIWSAFIRIAIVTDIDPFEKYSRQWVLIAFGFYLIGAIVLYVFLRKYYLKFDPIHDPKLEPIEKWIRKLFHKDDPKNLGE
jgi:hypothetical protein